MNGPVAAEPKDCECIPELHDGPHWRHVDESWKTRNLEMLARADDESRPAQQRWLGYLGFANEEIARLKTKECEMRAHGITDTSASAETPS